MEFTVVQQKILDIPSASGIVKHDQSFFVIGDDSPCLFKLNNAFEIVFKYPIHSPAEDSENGTIPKKQKPDFEALEIITGDEIIVFGSGSKSPERDVFKRVFLKNTVTVKEHDLSGFYIALKKLPALHESELNIEAVAYSGNRLYLFNRRRNLVLYVNYTDFIRFIESDGPMPEITSSEFSLPRIDGIEAGFSGATVAPSNNKILITASVEDTDNAYDDGPVLGSFIGMASIENNRIIQPVTWVLVDHPEPLKVESITVEQETSDRNIKVVLVTDSDGEQSYILKGNLKW